MPSIPLYGYDELEPSMLNSAKRRIVGLLEMSQEALTQKPETDPTNGKQNTFLEQLTEEVYTTIKDIEVLDSYISESDGVDAKDLRAEIKKGASQIALVNNALRKISSIYEGLRPNIIYTDLKIFTYFVNSIIILKKSALQFFEIVDDLIDNVNKAKGINYIRPVINKDEDIEPEPPTSSDINPSIMDTSTPILALPDIPSPPLPPPPPPPPRPPRLPPNLGKKMKEYKTLIRKVLNDANVLDPQVAVDFDKIAMDKVRNDKTFYDEAELQGVLTTLLSASAPPAQAPSTAPPIASAPSTAPPLQFNYTQQELDNLQATIIPKLPSNLTSDQKVEIQTAWMDLVQSSAPDLPTEDEIDDMIDGIIDNPFSQAPTALASSSSTPKDTIEKLVDSADELIDGAFLYDKSKDKLRDAKTLLLNRQKANKDTSFRERELRTLVNIGEAPYLKASVPIDLAFKKKYPEFGALKTAYMKSRKDLNTNYKKTEKKFESYMDTNKIPNEYIDKPTN